MAENYINHIALVLDASTSMAHLKNQVVQVADNQIAHLASRSKELDQETRVSIYTFSYANAIKCLIYDKDVLRLPSIKGLYSPNGNTALIDATLKALDDLGKTPELYGEHSFLTYVLTDGQENASRNTAMTLQTKLKGLPDHWTVAGFVPDALGLSEAKRFGFTKDNLAVWDTTAKGMVEAGEVLRKATDTFMNARKSGIRGTKSLFTLDMSGVTSRAVSANLQALHFGQYRFFQVADQHDGAQIAPYVEAQLRRPYRLGEAYYQLVKTEKIQPSKQVALQAKKDGKVYTGAAARQLLQLPDNMEVKVGPNFNSDFDVFIQSTSVNRKLVAGQKVLVLS